MADKITTLQDKQGNNVFPIAGGVNADTITTAMLQANAITTAKIADGNVTTDKLAGNAITTAKVSNGAITNSKLGLSTEDVSINFYIPNVSSYTVTAKLLKLGDNIGVLMYTGATGMRVGPGLSNVCVDYGNANFDAILGASLQYNQSSNVDVTTRYTSFYPSYMDGYVGDLTSNREVGASMIIIGTLSS